MFTWSGVAIDLTLDEPSRTGDNGGPLGGCFCGFGSVSHDAISRFPDTQEIVTTPTAETANINDDDEVRHWLLSLDVDVDENNGSTADNIEDDGNTTDLVVAPRMAALVAAANILMVVFIYGGEC